MCQGPRGNRWIVENSNNDNNNSNYNNNHDYNHDNDHDNNNNNHGDNNDNNHDGNSTMQCRMGSLSFFGPKMIGYPHARQRGTKSDRPPPHAQVQYHFFEKVIGSYFPGRGREGALSLFRKSDTVILVGGAYHFFSQIPSMWVAYHFFKKR